MDVNFSKIAHERIVGSPPSQKRSSEGPPQGPTRPHTLDSIQSGEPRASIGYPVGDNPADAPGHLATMPRPESVDSRNNHGLQQSEHAPDTTFGALHGLLNPEETLAILDGHGVRQSILQLASQGADMRLPMNAETSSHVPHDRSASFNENVDLRDTAGLKPEERIALAENHNTSSQKLHSLAIDAIDPREWDAILLHKNASPETQKILTQKMMDADPDFADLMDF